MLKPLVRVIPTYSGNVKIVCNLSDYIKTNTDIYDCYVRDASLSPLSHTMYNKDIEANLLSSNYSYDLKNFYKYYADNFFTNGMSFDLNNVQQIDKHNLIYDRNLDLEYGCQRVNCESGHQFEFFAPIYIEDSSDFPDSFYIELKFKKGRKEIQKTIKVNIMSDSSSPYNYLCHYLKRYGEMIDSKVGNISVVNNNATFTGIDLIHGGITTSTNNIVSTLFNRIQTMNAFDLCITDSFKNGKIVMKQVLPLCFGFNLDELMDSMQSRVFRAGYVEVSGYYMKDGNRIDLYDWSCDYSKFLQSKLVMNESTGILEYVNGDVPNIMDDGFPSLHETRIQKYVWSSKISRMYSRWKMQASNDDNPYIINMAFAFSRNQGSINQYREFPRQTYKVNALATSISSSKSSLASEYSLIFPLGNTKENYLKDFPQLISLYADQVNKYGYNWFDIAKVNSNDLSWVDEMKWGNVINGECYYKGILHSISQIYNIIGKNKEKIDKFGVFLNPTIDIKNGEEENKVQNSEYTIKTSNEFVANAYSSKTIVASMIYSGPIAKAACEAFLSTNPNEYQKNSQVTNNESFIKMSTDINEFTYENDNIRYSYLPEISFTTFVNINDLGFDMDDINTWYNYSDFQKEFNIVQNNLISDNVIMEELSYKGIHNVYQGVLDDAKNLFKQENISILMNGKSYEMLHTYSNSCYELLPLHTASLLVNSYTVYNQNTLSYEKQWSYLKISGKLSYVSYEYGIKLHYYENGKDINPDIDEWVYGKDGELYKLSPGYNPEMLDIISSKDSVEYDEMLSTIVKDQNMSVSGNIKEEGKYEYYIHQYPEYTIYKDRIVDDLYISSKSNSQIRNTSGFTYYRYEDPTTHKMRGDAYSYIVFSPQELINQHYGFNLYRKSEFISEKWLKMLSVTDTDTIVNNYVSHLNLLNITSKYNIDEFNIQGTSTYALRKCLKSVYDKVCNTTKERLDSKNKYTFMPVIYGNAETCAENVFIKKDNELKFHGNRIDCKDIDTDLNVIWCDSYNFKRLLKKFGFTPEEIEVRKEYIKQAKARFLNKEHLYWWYNELYKNFDHIDSGNLIDDWYDRIYVKSRIINVDNDGHIQVVDGYKKLSNIPGMEKKTKDGKENILRRFNYFYDRIEVRANDGLWQFKDSDKDELGGKVYDIVFDISVTRLDNAIYDKIVKIDSDDKYKDLYMYRLENNDEWERKMELSEIPSIEYKDNNYDDVEQVGHLLIPLFNDIYVQDKKDTEIYAHYLLHDIIPIEVEDPKGNWKMYRYNSNDIPWMIEIDESTRKYLSQPYNSPIKIDDEHWWQPTMIEYLLDNELKWPFKNSLSNLIYYNYDSVKIGMSNHGIDMLGYGIDNFCTIKKDGTNYGFWCIDLNMDNTTNSMNIIAQFNSAQEGKPANYSYSNNIKWIKYINGTNIIENPNYVVTVLKQLMPFLKKQPFEMISNMITVLKPLQFRIPVIYSEYLCPQLDENNKPSEMKITINEFPLTYIALSRYFGNIVPLITKVDSISNQWLLKFKDVNDTSIRIVNTGLYPSIDDCVLYKTSLQLDIRNSVPIYGVSTNKAIPNYKNVIGKANALEQKHFNSSIIVYADKEMKCETNNLYHESELEYMESDEKKFEVFKKLYKGSNIDNMDDDQILFLYNRYKSLATSVPIRLNMEKTSKLYKIHYRYILK